MRPWRRTSGARSKASSPAATTYGGTRPRWCGFPRRSCLTCFSYPRVRRDRRQARAPGHGQSTLLFARGSADAKLALAEKFNLQLAGAVFCWLEEAALSRDAYLRIKEWVDAPRMTIRAMRRDGYSIPNYAHFTQSGNRQDNCPFELGDTRVVVIEVPPLTPEEWLNWDLDLAPALEHEAPEFLGRLYALPMPDRGCKRLYLPVLTTTVKKTTLEAMRRQSEEKEGRKSLLQAMSALATQGRWKGTAQELIVALGKSHGEWSSIAPHFGRQLKKIRKELLRTHRVKVSYSSALATAD